MRRRSPLRVAGLATALALTVAGLPAVATATDDEHSRSSHKQEPLSVGYFTQWGIYGKNFHVKNLDTSGAAENLTHINYAFGNVSEDGKCSINIPILGESDPWADYQRPVPAHQSVDGVGDVAGDALMGNFGQLQKLKAKHPRPQGQHLPRWLVVVDVLLECSADPGVASERSSSRASTSTSRVTCPRKAAAVARGPRRACSTASTSTGSGPTGRVTSATSSDPRTARTSPHWSRSSASSSMSLGARHASTTS